MAYEIELAREIISSKEVTNTSYIPIKSDDNQFVKYEDDYIEIIVAKNTKALHIRIFKPLTNGNSNPIVYVDDDGKCYRTHGEKNRFIMYAEKLLNKQLTIGMYEYNLLKQEEINNLFQ